MLRWEAVNISTDLFSQTAPERQLAQCRMLDIGPANCGPLFICPLVSLLSGIVVVGAVAYPRATPAPAA